MLLIDSAGNDGGAAGQTVFAGAARARCRRRWPAPVRGRWRDPVRRRGRGRHVRRRPGTGVALAAGEEIARPGGRVSLDPKRTLDLVVDPVAIGPSLLWRAGNIRTPGVVSKVNLVLAGCRGSPGRRRRRALLRGRIVVAPGIDAMERAFDASKYGRVSRAPVLEATIPSLVDPSLVAGAPTGATS